MSGVSNTIAQPVFASSRQPLGYKQTTVAASTGLNPPAGAVRALIRTEAKDVRWRDDGTAPTATVGMPLAIGDTLEYTGDLSAIRFIEQAASALLNITFYE